MKMNHRYEELFRHDNDGSVFYTQHKTKIIEAMKNEYHTLPIAAAYNAGFNEGYMKARNELCHISQTKKD